MQNIVSMKLVRGKPCVTNHEKWMKGEDDHYTSHVCPREIPVQKYAKKKKSNMNPKPNETLNEATSITCNYCD